MLLPFNFDQLADGSYFVSNDAGFHLAINRDELEAIIHEDFQAIDPSLREALKRKLFIQDQKFPDYGPRAIASAQAKRLLRDYQFSPTFMIVPTLRCDHTCYYCQVSRAAINAQNYDLEPDKVPKILKLIQKLGSPPYKLEVQGGEPLLRFDLVSLIYEEAIQILGEGSFEMVITTSLSLLSNDILNWAKDRTVFFSTSLDGNAFLHDKNRILPGNSSFEKVKTGVNKILSSIGIDRVSTVTTITRSHFGNANHLAQAHVDLGLKDLFVRPVSPYGFANRFTDSEYSFDEFIDFYDDLLDILVELNLQGYPIIEHSAIIHLRRIFDPTFNGYADLKSPSGFLLDCVMFNYDGKIFGSDEARMLQRVIGNVDFSCGSIDSINFTNNPLSKNILRDSLNFLHPGCEQCAFQPFCGSDPCQAISEQGEPIGDKSISTFCNYHKSMFRFLLSKYRTDTRTRSVFERWLYA